MKTSDQLTVEYAENRIRFREIKDEIHNLCYPDDNNGEFIWPMAQLCLQEKMHEFFKEWCDEGDDDYYGCEPWPEGGWIEAFEDVGIDDPDMLALAKLWQRKKVIICEAGQIKRNIAARGRKLLRLTQEGK